MRKVIRANSPVREEEAKKRRGRKPKTMSQTLAKMLAEGDPDIRFVRDLDIEDRFAVEGDNKNFDYAWVIERTVTDKIRKGYELDPGSAKSRYDDNRIPAEGVDRDRPKSDMVLMRIPKSVNAKRKAIKREKIEAQSEAFDKHMKSSINTTISREIPDDDPFITSLANGG